MLHSAKIARIIKLEAELKCMRPVYRAAVAWEREYKVHLFPRAWKRSFEKRLAIAIGRAEKARKK